MLFIKRKFVIRHKILQALQICYNQRYRPDSVDSREFELSWPQLKEATGLNDEDILEQIDVLLTNDEVYNNEEDFNSSYLILQKGTIAFYDKKYLNLGIKEFKDDLYDIVKLVSAVVLLVIAVISFVRNIINTEKNSRDIEELKREILLLKLSVGQNTEKEQNKTN